MFKSSTGQKTYLLLIRLVRGTSGSSVSSNTPMTCIEPEISFFHFDSTLGNQDKTFLRGAPYWKCRVKTPVSLKGNECDGGLRPPYSHLHHVVCTSSLPSSSPHIVESARGLLDGSNDGVLVTEYRDTGEVLIPRN